MWVITEYSADHLHGEPQCLDNHQLWRHTRYMQFLNTFLSTLLEYFSSGSKILQKRLIFERFMEVLERDCWLINPRQVHEQITTSFSAGLDVKWTLFLKAMHQMVHKTIFFLQLCFYFVQETASVIIRWCRKPQSWNVIGKLFELISNLQVKLGNGDMSATWQSLIVLGEPLNLKEPHETV